MKDALLLTMMNPPPDGDAEFNDWADTEHIPERKVVPGIRTAVRFRNSAPSPRYMAIYDLEDISVLKSPAYMAIAGDNLSPWSQRILAGATARWRFEGERVDAGIPGACTDGHAQLAELLLVTWRDLPGRCDDAVVTALNAAIADAPGVLQWRMFCGQRDGRTDYVGVVESGQSLDRRPTDTGRFSTASLRCDAAHLFHPI